MDRIVIKGAREHNLKGIDLELPKNSLIVITGVSGSGKSSLAFDTIYAEGERRYVESLSAYARQFLEKMDKPDVESIEGLSPSISIEQRTISKNPRSTVGTVTEVYDYLRLLFTTLGTPHCYRCGRAITTQSIQQMTERLLELPQGTKLTVFSPIVRGRKGEYRKELAALRRDGYTKARIDGKMVELIEVDGLDKRKKHYIDVIIDRLVVKEGVGLRLSDALELATGLSGGIAKVETSEGREFFFNEKLSCIECGISYPEITLTTFSFNSPHGACPECKGLGEKTSFDPSLVVPDQELSLIDGAIAPWNKKTEKKPTALYEDIILSLSRHYGFALETPFRKLPKKVRDAILFGTEEEIEFIYRKGGRRYSFFEPFEGVIPNLERRYKEATSDRIREELEQYINYILCPACKGSRLKREALHIKVAGLSIWDITRMTVRDAILFFQSLELDATSWKIAEKIVKEITARLIFLHNVGLGYITLDRPTLTLSGGEAQRIKLATQIGSGLVGVLYVLDEPSIGLHQRDTRRLLKALKRLRDMGNTVIVVEHDETTIRSADFVVDMGPGAGEEGGRVVATGSPADIMANPDSLTGKYLSGVLSIPVPSTRKKPDGRFLTLKGVRANNIRGMNVRIPLGLITCVTGVSGSGKSTLVVDTLYKNLTRILYGLKERAGFVKAIDGLEHIDKVISVDQSPIGRTPRSNPATYTGVFTPIRELFSQLPDSRMRGYGAGRFSFNVKGGRCETCKGEGTIKVEMHFLPDVYVRCDACGGRRYNPETLEVKYRGKDIAECLEMTVTEALEFFKNIPVIRNKLTVLKDVGLGYIRLGQPATTLSGGEAQRIKLAKELSRPSTGKTLYILDEPTTGLHFADIEKLLTVIRRLTDAGNTVVIIEHNMDVIKFADYIIDLGPEGGDEGGRLVACGTPEEVAKNRLSYTGAYLKEVLALPARKTCYGG